MFSAKILADSISEDGARLTTFELTFPRVILAEWNTHRMISRNAASSRAIPTEKLIQRILDDPFIPEFCANQKGMQAGDAIEEDDAQLARLKWLDARDFAIGVAKSFHALNIHKQYVNRLLEPWMWCTVIASATEWANLFALRCNPQAEPSFQRVAGLALDAYRASTPCLVPAGQWHLPLFYKEDWLAITEPNSPTLRSEISPNDIAKKVSVGRCARVSYLTHDGKRDFEADIELHDRLALSGHWSPFEHVATPFNSRHDQSGNFVGWDQYRKGFAAENLDRNAVPGCVK